MFIEIPINKVEVLTKSLDFRGYRYVTCNVALHHIVFQYPDEEASIPVEV